jgi:hypothetical protein
MPNADSFADFYKQAGSIRCSMRHMSFSRGDAMKKLLGVISTFIVLMFSSDFHAQTNLAQVLSTAEITKIDARKKVLQVRELAQPSSAPSGRRSSGGSARRAGGGRRGGVNFPGRTAGGRYPSGGTRRTPAKEFKVYVTENTVMKIQDDIKLDFTDLHVGDRINISGTPKGSKGDLQATTITRDLR